MGNGPLYHHLSCKNGHEIRQYPPPIASVSYICNQCGDAYDDTDPPPYLCVHCRYNMCPRCADEHPTTLPTNTSVYIKCLRKHFLALYESIYGNNDYCCARCRNRYNNREKPSFHCKECRYDLCPECSDEDSRVPPVRTSASFKCGEGHSLSQYVSIYGNNKYSCCICHRTYNNREQPALHCQQCRYDLCPECSGERQRPPATSLRIKLKTSRPIQPSQNIPTPSPPPLAQPSVEIELFTFNLVISRGNTIPITMETTATLNDLARKMDEDRGMQLRGITIESRKFTVAMNGQNTLASLGVEKQSKVIAHGS